MMAAAWLLSASLAVAQTPEPPAPAPEELPPAPATGFAAPSKLVFKIHGATERIEMTVNTSRILTLDHRIPQAQVNNPSILDLTPLSPNEIQISAKTPGATQVNLWGEDKRVYTIDVIVYGDAEALSMLLRSQFPTSSLRVVPVANGVLISGNVDRPEYVDTIVRIAEEYYPKVINNITVGGVQQVLLHVKVMEVSRTKLRRLGVDWAYFNGNNFTVSGVAGLISSATDGIVKTTGNETFSFGIVNGTSAFFGVLEALRQDDLAKVMAEPTLTTISGRPAQFNVGGEFPIPVPQSLGTISIEYKKYGTQLDFVPIVLGNGLIRLEIRPRVSEIDNSRNLTLDGTIVPGLRIREVETGAEIRAGQTMAIAGLCYHRTEAQNRGLPWISEVPYLGVPFRKAGEQTNEIEMLVLVTPELVEPMNCSQVPPCGPGSQTTSPSDWELYLKGHLEVPKCCPNGDGSCAACNGAADAADGMPAGMIGPVDSTTPGGPQAAPGTPRDAPNSYEKVSPGAAGYGPSANRGATQASYSTNGSGRPQVAPATNNPYDRSPRARPTSVAGEPALMGPVGYESVP